jgi:hypothetical protein
MAYEIGFVDNTGSEGVAHKQMLLKIKTLAEANGWTTLRYDNTSAIRELILKGVGLSGTEEIFIGFRSYENVAADYYNISVAGFIGYVPENTFAGQPGYYESGIPAHNNRIDYWIAVNAQRIVFGLKVGTPVYEHGYVGKFLPYATPSQYPYPMYVGGMLTGLAATRFSDTVHTFPYRINNARAGMRFNDGAWKNPYTWPWFNNLFAGAAQLRDTNGTYPLLPVTLLDNSNVYGELDGVFYISGFNNAVENTLSIDGVTYVIIQDTYRTGFTDYLALRMQ